MSVVAVLFKGQCTDEDVGVSSFSDRGLCSKLVFFVVFTFTHAVDMQFVQAVDFVFVATRGLFTVSGVAGKACVPLELFNFFFMRAWQTNAFCARKFKQMTVNLAVLFGVRWKGRAFFLHRGSEYNGENSVSK